MREPTEFTIDAFKLRARPLPANQQLSILTTVSPLLAAGIAEIAPVYMQFKQDGIKSLSEVPMARMLSLITPVARELSKMPKGEMWGVIGECLGCVDLFKAVRGPRSGTTLPSVPSSTSSTTTSSSCCASHSLCLRLRLLVFFPEARRVRPARRKPKRRTSVG